MNNLENAAIRYAEIGWPVIPLHTPTGNLDRPCSCHKPECGSVGKHPRTRNGVKDASNDHAKIIDWWAIFEDANIGVATGKDAGFFVVDIDPRNGGDESLAELERKHGELPATRTSDTGSGGSHLIFQYPDFPVKNSKGELGPGLDVKSDGGYIVAPPSLHASGQRYRWRNGGPIAKAPEWLLERLRESSKKSSSGACAEVGEVILEGKRNETLTSLGGTMRRRGLGVEEIAAALLAVNTNRCNPPLDQDEVRKIASSVCRYAPESQGAFNNNGHDPAALGHERKPRTQTNSTETHAEDKSKAKPVLRVRRLADVEPEQICWLWAPYLPLGKLTLLEGDPGLGKSWLTCAIASGVARGKGLPSAEECEARNILLLSAEDGLADTIRPRLDSMNADVSRIFAIESPIIFDEAGLRAVEEVIAEKEPALVIVDPIVAYFGGGIDLHRANETREVMARLAITAQKFHCAILCVRHLAKGGTNKAIYRGLGSIDIAAAARSVLLVGADPDQPTKRAIVQIKNNLAAFGEPVGYQLRPDEGFFWTGASDLTAERILNGRGIDEEENVERSDAKEFLKDLLSAGEMEAKEIERARRAAGISDYSLRKGRIALGVKARKSGFGKHGEWFWSLPGENAQSDKGSYSNDLPKGVEGDGFQRLRANHSDTSSYSDDLPEDVENAPKGVEDSEVRRLRANHSDNSSYVNNLPKGVEGGVSQRLRRRDQRLRQADEWANTEAEWVG